MSNVVNVLETGSSPSRGTTFPGRNEEIEADDTFSAQNEPESGAKVRFPKTIKHRRAEATIYGKSKAYPFFRVAYHVDGKRHMKSFAAYSGVDGARQWADKKVREVAAGSKLASLSAGQASDALAAFDRLHRLYQNTGRRVSLLAAVSEFAEATAKLGGHTLNEAVDGFLTTAAVVKRKLISDAAAEFIESRKHLGQSKDGKRPRHSPVYEDNVRRWLNEFAAMLPGYAVCDLSKELINAYMSQFSELGGKSRNDRRAVVKMFLRWCVCQDYLSPAHRLLEAVGLKVEQTETADIDYYRPNELADMLNSAAEDLLPIIALGALGGLRREEILRLHWAEVWRVEGKIEISARIAKGRKRRLVDICTALGAWLRPYRNATGPVWAKSPDILEEGFAELRDSLGIPARRNGLRHAFITFHMALHSNENLTAAEAGNSPQMIHDHYRALDTKAEAEKWFAVKPARATNVIPLTMANK